jgi:hypothetical protein
MKMQLVQVFFRFFQESVFRALIFLNASGNSQAAADRFGRNNVFCAAH